MPDYDRETALIEKITRELNYLTLSYRLDNKHQVLAKKIIDMVRESDSKSVDLYIDEDKIEIIKSLLPLRSAQAVLDKIIQPKPKKESE